MSELMPELHEAMQKCVAYFEGIERENRYEVLNAALACLSSDEIRDSFAADFSTLSRLWQTISPDPVLRQHQSDYEWLTVLRKFAFLKNHTLCPVPWMQQTVRENGMVGVCCGASDEAVLRDDGKPFRIVDDSSVGDVVNSRYMRDIKKTMMAGEWPDVCRGCEISEKTGFSYRTLKQLLFDEDEFLNLVELTAEDGTSPPVVAGMHYIPWKQMQPQVPHVWSVG